MNENVNKWRKRFLPHSYLATKARKTQPITRPQMCEVVTVSFDVLTWDSCTFSSSVILLIPYKTCHSDSGGVSPSETLCAVSEGISATWTLRRISTCTVSGNSRARGFCEGIGTSIYERNKEQHQHSSNDARLVAIGN